MKKRQQYTGTRLRGSMESGKAKSKERNCTFTFQNTWLNESLDTYWKKNGEWKRKYIEKQQHYMDTRLEDRWSVGKKSQNKRKCNFTLYQLPQEAAAPTQGCGRGLSLATLPAHERGGKLPRHSRGNFTLAATCMRLYDDLRCIINTV